MNTIGALALLLAASASAAPVRADLAGSDVRAAPGLCPAGEMQPPAAPAAALALPSPDGDGDEDDALETARAGQDGEQDGDEPGDDGEEPGAQAAAGNDDGEAEAATAQESDGTAPGGPRYTGDLDETDLAQLWQSQPAALGSLSIGFADAGRLVNGRPFPQGKNWTVVSPAHAWATQETIDYLAAAIDHVAEQYEDTPPLRVNHISKQDGGWLRPHKSHQSGRDADLAFYYSTPVAPGARVDRLRVMDLQRNWALVRALVTLTDVQLILVDKKIIQALYDYALASGEDQDWLDSIFRSGKDAIVKHAKRHKDHFHVRFYNPRAQELGRRVQPLLAQGPQEQNVAIHKVRRGESLGRIARIYGTTTKAVRSANGGLRTLKVGRSIVVPLRGACGAHCPVPPELVVPPRRLPPSYASEPVASHP